MRNWVFETALDIFATWWFEPLICQTEIVRNIKFGCKDIGIRKLEFVAKTQSYINIYQALIKYFGSDVKTALPIIFFI